MPYCEKHNIESEHKCKQCTVEKREQTMLERYGVRSALHSKDIKEKKNKTCLDKYGVEHSFSSDQVKQKCKDTLLEKYGVECSLSLQKVKEIREKKLCLKSME
jgi:hypothetical protein